MGGMYYILSLLFGVLSNLPSYSYAASFLLTTTTTTTTSRQISHKNGRLLHQSVIDASSSSFDVLLKSDDINDWEECMRSIATEALLPVFYNCTTTTPSTVTKSNNSNNNVQSSSSKLSSSSSLSSIILTPEKSLKKLLKQYQKFINQQSSLSASSSSLSNTTSSISALISTNDRRMTRKRLSELVLGTSVMRLKYYHDFIQQLQEKGDERYVETIIGLSSSSSSSTTTPPPTSSSSLKVKQEPLNSSSSLPPVERMEVIRAMVDMHATTTTSNSTSTSNEKDTNIIVHSAMDISHQYSLPLFFTEMLVDQYGLEMAKGIANSCNTPGPITLRRNAIKCPSDDLLCQRIRKEDSLDVQPLVSLTKTTTTTTTSSCSTYSSSSLLVPPDGCLRLFATKDQVQSIWSMTSWIDGNFEVQDTGSQLIADTIEAKSGETIVDFCSGNGGKTFAIASKMFADATTQKKNLEEGGEEEDDVVILPSNIIAHDIIPDRLKRLRGSMERIGLNDDNEICKSIVIRTTSDQDAIPIGVADAVLVDAPCSSSGVLRRRPSQRFELKEMEIRNDFPELQLQILMDAAKLVRSGGGRLVYATCSILHFENEDVVKAFEESEVYKDYDYKRWSFHHMEEEDDNYQCCDRNMSSLLPSIHESDGFFIARWTRN